MAGSERARLVVHIKPNARQNQITTFKEGVLEVRVAAPPVEGKANEALIKFLSECLGVGKSRLAIEKGMTGRMKTVSVQGLSQAQATERLKRMNG